MTSFVDTEFSFAGGKNRISLKNVSSNFVMEPGMKHRIKYKRYGKAKKGKIRFKSSNKKVLSVTKKGVLTAKKKGTAKITAYVKIKGRKRYKKTVKIRVGARVQSIRIKGYECVRKGKTVTLTRSVSPSNAANKAVTWSSKNKSIAKVSSSGKVTGVKEGNTVIRAKAKDGSGTVATYNVHVYKFYKNDTKWVAHRGLHTSATENTKAAFEAAGKAGGFWGCECDIWETAHSEEDDSFGLVVNHDDTFDRVFGVDRSPRDMTVEKIKNHSKLDKVCFLEDFLRVCYKYNMSPIIEIKDTEMSDEAIEKAVDMVYEVGLEESRGDASKAREFLERTDWISFYSGKINRTGKYIREEYEIQRPMLTYLLRSTLSYSEIKTKIDIAKDNNYTNVSLNRNSFADNDDKIADLCSQYGLNFDLWTFKNSSRDYYLLHEYIEHSKYRPEHMTVDYKPW